MRIILLIVSLALLSLLVVWTVNMYLNRQEYAMTTTQQLIEDQGREPAENPVEFSRGMVEDINKKTNERSNELNQLP